VIDLHCHILPGIDDGARDLDDAVAMARQAANDGVRVVCATPHIRHDHDVRIHELEGRVADLSEELRRRDVRVRIAPAGELAETAADGLNLDELQAISLGGGGRWLLVEPAPGPIGDSLARVVELLRERGFRSVIAHPERHYTDDMRERLAELVAHGALVQVTAAHLASGPAAAAMLELAGAGLVHVLGSDAHSSTAGRPATLSAGYAALATVPALAGHIDWIAYEAPAAILRGDDVAPPFPADG
jgi:protein-tyrosine phosphatase